MYPDGIFYIPIKKLKNKPYPSYEMKDLIKETLGLDIQSGIKNFFRGKSMLLIFDDFDLFYGKDIEPPQMLFQLKDCSNISCILVTTSKSKMEKNMKKKYLTEYKLKKSEIEGELLEKNAKWKLKPMTEDELAHMLLAWTKIDKKHLGAFQLRNIKESLPTKHLQGSPKNLIDYLIAGRIEVLRKVLEIDPHYQKHINIEHRYLAVKHVHQSLMSLSNLMKQHSVNYSDREQISRMHSNIETRVVHESPLHNAKKDVKHNSMPPEMPKSGKSLSFQERGTVSSKGGDSERSFKANSNNKAGRHKAKKPSFGESDESSLILTKSDFDPSESNPRKLTSPNKKIHERDEEEKGLPDALSEVNSEYRPMKGSESLEYQEVWDKLDLVSDSNDVDIDAEDVEEGSTDIINNELGGKMSPDISFTESEIVTHSQKKCKNEESQKPANPPVSNSKKPQKKNPKSGRHKNRFQKNKSSKYYSFKDKKDPSNDGED